MLRTFGRCQATDLPRTGQARQHRYQRGWQLYAPASLAIGVRTVQPMFVYDAISRRPISTNMDAKGDVYDVVYFLDADRSARVVGYQTIIIDELIKCGKQIIINGKDYADMSSNC